MSKHTKSITVDAASAATSHIGFIGEHLYGSSVYVEEVVAEQEGASDADFNVELGGSDLFGSEQSVSSADTPEVLNPDQNEAGTGSPLELAVDVSAAGSAGDLNITVVYDDGTE